MFEKETANSQKLNTTFSNLKLDNSSQTTNVKSHSPMRRGKLEESTSSLTSSIGSTGNDLINNESKKRSKPSNMSQSNRNMSFKILFKNNFLQRRKTVEDIISIDDLENERPTANMLKVQDKSDQSFFSPISRSSARSDEPLKSMQSEVLSPSTKSQNMPLNQSIMSDRSNNNEATFRIAACPSENTSLSGITSPISTNEQSSRMLIKQGSVQLLNVTYFSYYYF